MVSENERPGMFARAISQRYFKQRPARGEYRVGDKVEVETEDKQWHPHCDINGRDQSRPTISQAKRPVARQTKSQPCQASSELHVGRQESYHGSHGPVQPLGKLHNVPQAVLSREPSLQDIIHYLPIPPQVQAEPEGVSKPTLRDRLRERANKFLKPHGLVIRPKRPHQKEKAKKGLDTENFYSHGLLSPDLGLVDDNGSPLEAAGFVFVPRGEGRPVREVSEQYRLTNAEHKVAIEADRGPLIRVMDGVPTRAEENLIRPPDSNWQQPPSPSALRMQQHMSVPDANKAPAVSHRVEKDPNRSSDSSNGNRFLWPQAPSDQQGIPEDSVNSQPKNQQYRDPGPALSTAASPTYRKGPENIQSQGLRQPPEAAPGRRGYSPFRTIPRKPLPNRTAVRDERAPPKNADWLGESA
jgi:hypothetical protein